MRDVTYVVAMAGSRQRRLLPGRVRIRFERGVSVRYLEELELLEFGGIVDEQS